ncbi:hypothetical protein pb186bvf_017278 [Paramecium bursaria]
MSIHEQLILQNYIRHQNEQIKHRRNNNMQLQRLFFCKISSKYSMDFHTQIIKKNCHDKIYKKNEIQMNGQMCKCGKYEVEYISILYYCSKNKRFCCLACKTDNYRNQETFMAIFQKDSEELIKRRYKSIVYIFNQFRQRLQHKQFLSNDQQNEFYGFFEKKDMLTQQERLNEIQDITFQEIYNKIIEKSHFINLTEKEIQFILMIKYLSHDNEQLSQILYQLQNVQHLQSSSLLINLRLIVKKSNNIILFNKKFNPYNDLIIAKLKYAEDDLIYCTNFSYKTQQQYLQMYQEINMYGNIKDIFIIMNFIHLSVFLANLCLYQFTQFRRVKNSKKQKQFFFRVNQKQQCYFKMISKHNVILNQYDKGKIVLFCLRNKKIINIIQMKSEIFNYIIISNQFVEVENQQLNFYNLSTKKLKNKINLLWLEGRCEYISSKYEFITCTNSLVVQKIDYQSHLIKQSPTLNINNLITQFYSLLKTKSQFLIKVIIQLRESNGRSSYFLLVVSSL